MGETMRDTTILQTLRKVRQTRQFTDRSVPADVINELLEVARWTGSSKNSQPWHFIVIADKERLRQISSLRAPIAWVADAPLAIAIVLDGNNPTSEAYDEGRVTERLMIAAKALGLAAGTAWFGDASQQAQAKAILGIPEEKTARSLVAISYPAESTGARRPGVEGGRKPLTELVSYESFGSRGV